MRGWSMGLIVVVSLSGFAWAKDKPGDHIVGALWSYTITREGKKETGQFRVFKKEMFHKDKKVGTVDVKDDDETTLHITGIPELNGTATLRKTQKHPPVAVGKLKRDDGTEWEMRVEVKEF